MPNHLQVLPCSIVLALQCALAGLSAAAEAQNITPICNPTIVANKVVATPAQREANGSRSRRR